ncbi:MAG: hypothetical protein HS104_24360 [Polyangiaceae bacterium]|nr:hypothetical protein [Polyangiaceae bacterium]MCL4756632.1 hypothetical protein [Myxococcales bacterium]
MAQPKMMHVMFAVALAATLITGVARAELGAKSFTMTPLAEEMLSEPITLSDKCDGVVVREWREGGPGTEATPAAIRVIDKLCNRALGAFEGFIDRHGLARVHSQPFTWSVSVIPDEDCYRCLNDMTYRFSRRSAQVEVWGYTSLNHRFIFILNQVQVNGKPGLLWQKVWVHELFHALSMHYGIFESHAGTDAKRVKIDERYAKKFEVDVLGK